MLWLMTDRQEQNPLSPEGLLHSLAEGAWGAREAAAPRQPRATPHQLTSAIAGALYEVSALSLADHCDDYGIPTRDGLDDPMVGKVRYVEARLRGLELPRLVTIGRRVFDDHPHEPLGELLALVSAHDLAGEARNVIFAADGPKPKIVLRDAISNSIEITEGADRCLMYDRAIGDDGLTWETLTSWWSDREGLGSTTQRDRSVALYRRLLTSMANGAERTVFEAFCSLYGEHGSGLPALLPQVYLHYDPYSRGRGGTVVRQRMDFLVLMSGGRRVVVEVDGIQHYGDMEPAACGGRHARPDRYAEMVREDRALRLAGYEVYRFGGAELVDHQAARTMLRKFFGELLGLTAGAP